MDTRYQRRKHNGLLKSAKEMQKKDHQKQKKKWRENSARYYEKKKNLNAILNITPPSPEDLPAVEIIIPASMQQQPAHLQPANQHLSPVSDTGPEMFCITSTPKSTSSQTYKKKTISNLRMKLKKAEEKLKMKNAEMEKMRKKIDRMQKKGNSRTTTERETQRHVILQRKKQKDTPIGSSNRLSKGSIRNKMINAVHEFLHQDDASTIINGKNGEIRRKGQIFRKRYLTDTLENLHKKFISENPAIKLSRAQFCKHRPFWIVRPKVTDRETCACKIHENFKLKINKLYQLGVIVTRSTSELVETVVCNKNNMDCMYQRCQKCNNKTLPVITDENTKQNIISWEEWVTKTTLLKKKHKDGSFTNFEAKYTCQEKRSSTLVKLVDLANDHLPGFCTHIYNISHQYDRMKELKDRLAEDEVVVHIDYSENYSCKYHKEVKETHFGGSHAQITLHTGVIYLSGGRIESFSTVSDSLQHDAVATWAHLDPVLDYIRSKYPSVIKVHFLSDGPTSQYRNKTCFYLTATVPFMKGFHYVTWSYTEASHGKGAPDGVGGALKNLADRIVAHGTNIPNVDTLMEQLSQHSSVKLYRVTEEDIEISAELVPPYLKTIPGTMKFHQLTSSEPGKIRAREVSCFCSMLCDCFSPKDFNLGPNSFEEQQEVEVRQIEVGMWVLVKYDSELFPGVVTQVVNEQYEVDAMSRAGDNRFFNPSLKFPVDKIWYYREDIIDIIPEPLPATSSARHFCVLPEIWAKHQYKAQ